MKVKKTKTPGPSVFSKAVSNVTKIIKTKDAKAIKKEGPKKSSQQKLKLIKQEIPDEAVKKVKKAIKKETEVVKKEVSGKPSKKNLQLVKKKPSAKAVKSLVKATKNNGKKTPKKSKEESSVEVYRKPVMYIGHIPHGFYESEMKEYFEQFGTVTQVRVARSKKTGKSRGYGYIEFEDKDVAKIAAETMNNYLMCGRLLKAHLIPDEKYHKRFFSGVPWTEKIYPKMTNRVSELRKNESPIEEKSLKKNTKKSLKKLTELETTLKNVGIKIKFKPKNVPK